MQEEKNDFMTNLFQVMYKKSSFFFSLLMLSSFIVFIRNNYSDCVEKNLDESILNYTFYFSLGLALAIAFLSLFYIFKYRYSDNGKKPIDEDIAVYSDTSGMIQLTPLYLLTLLSLSKTITSFFNHMWVYGVSFAVMSIGFAILWYKLRRDAYNLWSLNQTILVSLFTLTMLYGENILPDLLLGAKSLIAFFDCIITQYSHF